MIDYDLIGSRPHLRTFDLEAAVVRHRTLDPTSVQHQLSEDDLVMAVAHFYGLDAADFASTDALLDAAAAMEQEAAVH